MNQLPDHPSDPDLGRLASVNLNLLVPLLALLEEQSVTRAAARVGITQPAMSHALARMRRLLGDELVTRQGSGLVLTPRGRELIGPLRDVLRRTSRVVDFPGFDPSRDSRTITVAMTTSTAFVLGPHLARLIAERAPKSTLRIRNFVEPQPSDFTDEGVDVVLVSGAFSSPYPRERLYENRWVVVAHPDSDPDASALDLLASLPHVTYDARNRVAPYAAMDAHGLDYRIGQLISDFLLVPHLVAKSGGVAVHTYLVAIVMSERTPLRIEEFPLPVAPLGIDMVWNPRLADAEFIGWLRQILVEASTFGSPA
ncbi:LysR family transcriptional regulator [Rhodococcus sp. (in: high G+C Gram-positive bacteria)]|uniref:LysR family transcriptional regulator n=1 Tax=unclassified Rhodococcus (in: high G+C Gram-positive bacteria) TaxID=192944 RepID=UPI0019DF90B9|nr:LysR family transcriptional regulator [Rhodococcus sp. (in: high G+C Gram-positive bacteria)]MBF0663214.1 LysR family transcriptional regulator [Rhodococcus sp. (in: high G+C Gram-positive bacteria)]